MPGIMESVLHVCSSEEMCFEFSLEFLKYDLFSYHVGYLVPKLWAIDAE